MGVSPHKTPLGRAFSEDHRHLTRGLKRVLKAVEAGDLAAAVRHADEVDRLVGAHIEFEETVFYPRLSQVLGPDFVDRLYCEHDEGKRALTTLLAGGGAPLAAEERREVAAQLRTALEHALSCGTLLSHVTTLDDQQQQSMLDELHRLAAAGRRWTELPASRGGES